MENLRNCLLNALIYEYGYSEELANKTANDLLRIKHDDIIAAIDIWMKTRKITEIREGPISVTGLVKNRGMSYAEALIFLDWYREDPAEATDALTFMGDVVLSY